MDFNSNIISIVIPCYNDAQYVEQAVQSALNQTYPHKEVIVVDDGSNAETKAILKKIEPKITQLITQENKGQSAARNAGIKASTGDYILCLDSDDYFEPSFCEKAVQVLLQDKNVKIATCHAFRLYPDGSKDVLISKGGTILNFLIENDALGTSMFSKEDWLRCGGYDEGMRSGFEDWEFFIRILSANGLAYVIPEPLYTYRQRIESTTSRANKNKYNLLKYIYTKHQELYTKHFDLFVTTLLFKIEKEENEKIKNKMRLEFRIGKKILQPLRYIKSLFK